MKTCDFNVFDPVFSYFYHESVSAEVWHESLAILLFSTLFFPIFTR